MRSLKILLALATTICFTCSNATKLTTKYFPLPPPVLLQSPLAVATSASPLQYHGFGRIQAHHRQGLLPQATPTSSRRLPLSGSHSHYGEGAAAAYQRAAQPPPIPILRSVYTNDARGNYNFGFDTGNGIHRDETGELSGGWPHGTQSVRGSYSYTGDDGQIYTVKYKADGNGFHAEGAHLPTSPPIPIEIQQSLTQQQRRSQHATPTMQRQQQQQQATQLGYTYGQQPY